MASRTCVARFGLPNCQFGLRTNSAVGDSAELTIAFVTPALIFDSASLLVVTIRSQPSTTSASPIAMRVAYRSSGVGAICTCENTAPPFCARPAISSTESPLPSRCAAIPSSCPIVTTPVPPTPVTTIPYAPSARNEGNGGLRQFRNAAGRGRLALLQLPALDGDEARAKTIQARVVLVAGRLIDLALAAEFGFQRLDRQAIGLQIAIAATFAHQFIDDDTPRRVGKVSLLCRVLLAPAPLFGRARLVIDHHRYAAVLAQLELDAIELVAMVHGDAFGKACVFRIFVRLVGDDDDFRLRLRPPSAA